MPARSKQPGRAARPLRHMDTHIQIRSITRRRKLGRLGRVLILMVVLVTRAASPLDAQERNTHAPQAEGEQLSERSRKALEEAEELFNANDLKGAIKLLQPIAEGDDAEVFLLLTLSVFCEYSLDREAAEKWSRRAVERAERSREGLAGHAILGTTLFRLGRYQEAIPLLEAVWRRGGRTIDSHYVPLLARSYEETGASRAAQQAYETVLAIDLGNLEAWSALARIKAKTAAGTEALPGPEVPAPPDLKEFAEVMSLGDPLNWSREERVKGRAAQKRYAEALERSGLRLDIRAMKRETAWAAIKPCVERTDDRSMNCVKSLAVLAQRHPIHTFETKIQRLVYWSLAEAHIDLGQYVHALSALERMIAMPAIEESSDDVNVLDKFLLEVFVSVSWDPKSSQLRANDVDDFVELRRSRSSGRAVPRENTTKDIHGSARKPTRPSPREIPIGGARAPYGMASPDEDFATIGDWIRHFDEDFYELILLRIRQKNFELPVKVFLFQLATLNADFSTGVNDRYLKALDSAINEAGESVNPITLEAYVVAKRMFELMKLAHPRLSPARRPPEE